MPTSAGPDCVAEGAGWQAPARGRRPYRRRPVLGHGELREVQPTERGRVGSAAIGDRMDGGVALDRAAEAPFVFGDQFEAFWRHPSERRQLVGCGEEAMHAGDAAKPS